MTLVQRPAAFEDRLELPRQFDRGMLAGKGVAQVGAPCAPAFSRAEAVSSNRNSGAAMGVRPISTGSTASASLAMRVRSLARMQTMTCVSSRRRPESRARRAALGLRQAAAASFCYRPVSAPARRSSSAVTQSSVPPSPSCSSLSESMTMQAGFVRSAVWMAAR
jgi:hypothetical protein